MTGLDALADAFTAPPASARPWAFWFLNDDTPTDELLDQLDAFAAAGFGTVCPCARIGLGESVGYLTEDWWALMRTLVARCAELGLRVVLYDEASYPSGAANGLVVAEDPAFASRCLVPATVELTLGEGEVRYARPNLGRSLWNRRVATVVTPTSGRARTVTPDAAGLVRLDAAELGVGPVRVQAFFDCPSGGTIRGAHAWQDDGSALAPASADLLNPDAVAAFLRLTHDGYARHLGAWFGTTIVAMFTDEPAALGRGPRPDGIAWTPGLEHELADAAGVRLEEALAHLPELFEPRSRWQERHEAVVAERLGEVWYGAQRAWCAAHGIALTGHPERADELEALAHFTWPGQDTVWRWVLPGETALHGPESAGPRVASSAAVLRRLSGDAEPVPVLNEVYGAYGWRLTLDEMKWIADWLAVRGTTAFLLHALFASVRGNRAYESEPDLGLHNAWWPHLPAFLAHLARTTLLGEALLEEPRVALVVTGDRAPTEEAVPLYTHQIPFVYARPGDLDAVRGGPVDTFVCRPVDADAVRSAVAVAWGASGDAGASGVPGGSGEPVVVAEGDRWWASLPSAAPEVLAGDRSSLRVRTGRLAGAAASLLTNEGEEPITVSVAGAVWDPWTGDIHAVNGPWTLPRRAAVWVTGEVSHAATAAPPTRPDAGVPPELGPWRTEPPAPAGDWTADPAWETVATTVTYASHVDLAAPADLWLDLGVVGDVAEVTLNGQVVAHLFWAPHACAIPAWATRAGSNELIVRVSNSSANRFEGALKPSGLIGPVRLLASPARP